MTGVAERISPSRTVAPTPASGLPAGAPARLYYIDWLRVLAVLLLFPFHTLRVFNADDPFYVKATHLSGVLSDVLNFMSVWHMPLLFVLAGASTFFALGKRSSGHYLGERRKRLLVPFLFGIFVLIPPQTWYGGRFNSGYSASFWHYLTSGDFLKWNIKDGGDYYGGFGIGHLWFIIVLFLIAVIALPLLAWGRTERGAAWLGGLSRLLAHPVGWALAAVLLLVGSALPNPAGLQPFYYLVFFVLGYLAVCDGSFIQGAVRYRLPALAGGVALSIWWVLAGARLHDAQPSFSPASAALAFLGVLAAWMVIVGLLGCGKRYLDRTSPALSYLGEASYPVYILHQTVIVVVAWFIVGLAASEPLQWFALIVVSLAVTFALYEVVRRFAPTRFLFGMKPLKSRAATRVAGPAGATVPHASSQAVRSAGR
ncbi:MAG TPA: acyltransferase family protein [Thermoleophilia bacterium]|nr:acyltransferase family protein [Thermoleophilia bacterium]